MRRAALLLLLLLPGLAAQASAAPAALLQVLCYHRFAPACGKDPYCVKDKDLAAQLDWLKADGWQSVGLTQVARALDGTAPLPAKAVMLSVDDGYRKGARGADAFEAHGFHGVFFVNPGVLARGKHAAKSPFMSADEVRALEARGHDIGSHGFTHENMGKVPKGAKPADFVAYVRKELVQGRAGVEAILGHPVTDLAWPFGAYNQAAMQAARAAGYRQFYTVAEAAAEFPGADRLRLPRFLLAGHVPLASFRHRVGRDRQAETLGGLSDGQVLWQDQLPYFLEAGDYLVDERPVAAGAIPQALPAVLARGFHFLRTNGPGETGHRRLLFQVAPRAWDPHFKALTDEPQP